MKAVVDVKLADAPEVYFAPGCTGMLVHASREEFAQLIEGAWTKAVARPVAEVVSIAPRSQQEMRERVRQLHQLPAMPGMALQIMQIRNNPYSHVSELAAVVEQDPSLAAQILRYASSPFFGYQGKVDSVAMAIARVLGMDFVMDLAFGLSLGKPFRNPGEGPLGLNAFWQHATHTAALTQALCQRIPYMQRPSPGMAYLAGLLHNFGLLLLGHLFRDQFARLNRAVQEHPDRPLVELEREALGLTHAELGLWLMEEWNMPREIIEAVREHHNAGYRGDFAVYPNLVHIANVLLKRHGIGDADSMLMPPGLLESVGLDEVQAEAALGTVLESRESLEFIAKKMAA
jgi:HD-like signal output (HDOD) protein